MRAPIRTLLPTLVLSLAACVSGTRTIVVHDPGPQPPPPRPVTVMRPAPAPIPREALEVTLGRPMRGQIPIQTSRPAYVAVFEIIPNQGVTLVQPTVTQRRRMTPAGVSAVGMWWGERRGQNEAQPSRFVYVIASDQPLRLSDQAYQSDYWQRALGTAAYRGSNLYATMRAISRVVVPAVTEQDWAEDMLAIAPTYARQTPQQVPTARVYCPDGSVREVPMDFADRAICPMRVGSNDPGRLTRGDSAFSNGRRVDARGPRERVPVDRVGDPHDPHYGARNDPRNDPRGEPRGNGRPPLRPLPTPDDRHDAKRAEKEEKREARDERKEAKQEAKEERKEAKREEQAERKETREEARDARTEAKADAKEERREAREERREEKSEAKAEAKDERREAKPEPRDEPKAEPKAESKAESKAEKAEPTTEAKADPKPEKAESKDSARDEKDEGREEQKSDKPQPDAERRGPGRPAQVGKTGKKS